MVVADLEMPISHSVHPKIQTTGIVWSDKSRCPREYKKVMRIQKGRNY